MSFIAPLSDFALLTLTLTQTCRYYCYYSQAVRRLAGELLATNGYYDVSGQYKSLLASGRRAVQAVQGAAVDSSVLETIRSAVGEDFYVVVPCRMSSGQVAEGTRLTLLRHEPNGFEFTIRTPSTPQRFVVAVENYYLLLYCDPSLFVYPLYLLYSLGKVEAFL